MGIRGQYKNKRDSNEPQIIATLEAHGISVVRLDTPVDLACGYGDRDYLVEVKTRSGTLTGPQEIFYEAWRGSKTILRSVEDAEEFARKIRSE